MIELRDALKSQASIQVSEVGLDNTLLDSFIAAALSEHNPSYTLATIPDIEEELVLLLAHIRVCIWRANDAARNGNLNSSGSGFGEDRTSPVSSNLKVADRLRLRYDQLCGRMGLPSTAQQGTVSVSSNLVDDATLNGAMVPLSEAKDPPAPLLLLRAVVADNTKVIASWAMPSEVFDFDAYLLFLLDSGSDIFQNWNWNSSTASSCWYFAPSQGSFPTATSRRSITRLSVKYGTDRPSQSVNKRAQAESNSDQSA